MSALPETNRVHQADALAFCRELPDACLDLVVTSPPYWGLRDYGASGQIGLEDMDAYLTRLADIFQEIKRALKPLGSLYLNLGDSYAGSSCGSGGAPAQYAQKPPQARAKLPRKSLAGIPWRAALRLMDDGWILRNHLVWHKPNGAPHSVKDRFTSKHEDLFFFVKQQRYYFDLDAVREPYKPSTIKRIKRILEADTRFDPTRHKNDASGSRKHQSPYQIMINTARNYAKTGTLGKNPGDVWSVPTGGFRGNHFATYPEALCRRPILASCPPGGLVFDPFSGSGTTGIAALKNGRNFLGCDLNPEYVEMANKRLAEARLLNPAR